MTERKSKSCSVRKKVFRIILAILLILAIKITVTILSKPKVTTDYVAKLNQLTKPVNYTPQENAAPYYQKAFDLFYKMPEALYETDITSLISPFKIHWPGELDPNTVNMLQGWLKENQSAFEQIKLATEKPYYWIERKPFESKKTMLSVAIHDLAYMRDITEAMLWSAVIKAYNNNDETALDDILICYKMGMHKSNASLLMMEQYLGQRIKKLSAETTTVILDRKQVQNATLERFQNKLVSLNKKDNFIKGFGTEKLQREEFIEFTFACDPLGPDRLAFENYPAFQCMCGDPWYQWIYCFVGPGRKQVSDIVDKTFLLYEQLSDKTPWELENLYAKEIEQIETLNKSSFFTKLHAIPFTSIATTNFTNKSTIDALVTIVALLQYNANNDNLPESLDILVNEGYLEKLPMDPFSDKSFGYIATNGNFKLYSVGRDFEDNKAEAEIYEPPDPNSFGPMGFINGNRYMHQKFYRHGDDLFTYSDTIYWPVIRPEKRPAMRPMRRKSPLLDIMLQKPLK